MPLLQTGNSMVANTPTSHNWVSNMEMFGNLNMEKPEIYSMVVKALGDQEIEGIVGLNDLGFNPVQAKLQQHWEEDWLHQFITGTCTTTGNADDNITYTISGAYQVTYPNAAKTPYIDDGLPTSGYTSQPIPIAGVTNPVRPNDILQIANGGSPIEVFVVSVDYAAGTMVLRAIGSTPIPTLTSADQVIITGNTWGEGTSQPTGRNFRYLAAKANMQIFKGSVSSTNSQLGVKNWINEGKSWHFMNQLNEMVRFKNEMWTQLMVGRPLTNASLAILQPTNTKTQGLIPLIEDFGNNYTYFGQLTLADFESFIVNQLDKNRATMENFLVCGINVRFNIDAMLRAEMKNGGISYGAFNGDEKKAINLGFNSFNHGGYTWHLKTNKSFNYKMLLGAEGQPYKDMALVIPSGNTTASMSEGGGSKITVPYLRINYMSGNGENRLLKESTIGWENNEIDAVKYNMLSERGLEAFGLNRFGIMKKG